MGWLTLVGGLVLMGAGVWVGVALANLIRSFTDLNDVWGEDDEWLL